MQLQGFDKEHLEAELMTRWINSTEMSDQGQGGVSEEQRMAKMIQSLLKESEEAALKNSQAMLGLDASRDMSSPNQLASPQTADQAFFQQRAMDSLSFGAMNPSHQQLSSSLQPSDDLVLLSRQLQQQQLRQQQQQQQQLLFQAGGLAGPGLGLGVGGIGAGLGCGIPTAGLLSGHGTSAALASQGLQSLSQRGYGVASYEDTTTNSFADQSVRRRSESFPMTLHRLLADLEVAGASHIATFVAGGDAFLIRNPKEFEDDIVPKYFPRMGSFGSFQRQLNLYDFKRVSQGAHRGAYTHPLFRRQLPMLSRQMKRMKIKGLRKNFKKNQAGEINETATEKGEECPSGEE